MNNLARKWTRHFKDGLAMEILNSVEKPISHLVLNRLLPHMDKYNTIYGRQDELAIRANVSVRNFKVGIQELLKKDVIRKVRREVYMVTPELVIEGADRDQNVTFARWDSIVSKIKFGELNG